MDFLPEPFRSIVSFLVVLGVLIFIHELGHYLAARWRGVRGLRVLKFTATRPSRA